MSSALAFRGATVPRLRQCGRSEAALAPGMLSCFSGRGKELIESLFCHRHELISADANAALRVVALPQQQKSPYHRQEDGGDHALALRSAPARASSPARTSLFAE
jgi:hypothetical protein